MSFKSNAKSLLRRALPVPQSRVMTLEQDGKTVELLAPPEHMLDRYRATHPLYDRQLPRIALAVEKVAPGELFIDVGANIGDTVALLRLAGCSNPILAVEPSARFLRFASHNVKLFQNVELRRIFVGPSGAQLALDERRGTASSVAMAGAPEQQIPTVALGDLTARSTALVKTDTDGLDAKVLASGLAFLRAARPLIWSEAEVHSAADVGEWLEVLTALASCYARVIAFDNFGFPVVYGPLDSVLPTLRDLLEYCRRHAAVAAARGGEPRIYYLDLALFPERLLTVYGDAVTGFERGWG
jgi:FkbM family methyltransferase